MRMSHHLEAATFECRSGAGRMRCDNQISIPANSMKVTKTAYTLDLERRTIPSNHSLHNFRMGPGLELPARHNRQAVSFHYEGEVHFNIAHDIISRTVVVKVA